MLSPETQEKLDNALKAAKSEGFGIFGYIHSGTAPEFATFCNIPMERDKLGDWTEASLALLRKYDATQKAVPVKETVKESIKYEYEA